MDALTKLRKEQYLKTMKHDFSIMGSSVDLKLHKDKYKIGSSITQRTEQITFQNMRDE